MKLLMEFAGGLAGQVTLLVTLKQVKKWLVLVFSEGFVCACECACACVRVLGLQFFQASFLANKSMLLMKGITELILLFAGRRCIALCLLIWYMLQ